MKPVGRNPALPASAFYLGVAPQGGEAGIFRHFCHREEGWGISATHMGEKDEGRLGNSYPDDPPFQIANLHNLKV